MPGLHARKGLRDPSCAAAVAADEIVESYGLSSTLIVARLLHARRVPRLRGRPAGPSGTNPNRICRCIDKPGADTFGHFINYGNRRSHAQSEHSLCQAVLLCGPAAPPGLPTSAVHHRYRAGNSASSSAHQEGGGHTLAAFTAARGVYFRPRRGGGSGPRAAGLRLLLSSDSSKPDRYDVEAGVGFTLGQGPRARIIVVAFTDPVGSSQAPIRCLL